MSLTIVQQRLSLDAIGLASGTDKASCSHDFLHFYEHEFAKFRDRSFFLLEIGVYKGHSLETWGRYFQNAVIAGIDINPDSVNYNTRSNTNVRVGDASLLEVQDAIIEEFGSPLIVVDDGSHYWHHQIECLRYLWPRIRKGGAFVMEDLHTSFPGLASSYREHSEVSTYDYIMRLNRWVVGNRHMAGEKAQDGFIANYWSTIRSIHWHCGTCVIHKKP